MTIPFNRTHLFGEEQLYVSEVIASGEIAGNGIYTKKCHQFFKDYYTIEHCLLTNSCTAALEMAAILVNIQPGDEVIMPAYGYVSTENAFVMRGAKIVFVDSMMDSPNMDVDLLEDLITDRTKAIVVMHYGGIAVNMDTVMSLATARGIYVIEDAAHGVDAYYKGRTLGTIGHLGTLSFHSTKNITSGHGGLLLVNDTSLIDRSNVIWQKGTDKTKFDLGHQGYYEWVDIGSSFFPSEITAAYLYGQLLNLEKVTQKRRALWSYYQKLLQIDNHFVLPNIPDESKHNGHIYFLHLNDKNKRDKHIHLLKNNGIMAYSHCLNLNESPYYHDACSMPNARVWQECLLRLPLYYDLTNDQIDFIVAVLKDASSQ